MLQGLEMEKGSCAEQYMQPVEAGKGKRTDSSLKTAHRSTALLTP
jgi:hypothetical protein